MCGTTIRFDSELEIWLSRLPDLNSGSRFEGPKGERDTRAQTKTGQVDFARLSARPPSLRGPLPGIRTVWLMRFPVRASAREARAGALFAFRQPLQGAPGSGRRINNLSRLGHLAPGSIDTSIRLERFRYRQARTMAATCLFALQLRLAHHESHYERIHKFNSLPLLRCSSLLLPWPARHLMIQF